MRDKKEHHFSTDTLSNCNSQIQHHHPVSLWGVFSALLRHSELDMFVCVCVTASSTQIGGIITPGATAMLDLDYVINLPPLSFIFVSFRWAGQGAKENLHKMGQQASHQGKSQEFSWFDMCLFKLSINACRVFKCYIVLNVENSVLNLNSFSHPQWKYSFKLNHVTSHQLGSNKLQNLILNQSYVRQSSITCVSWGLIQFMLWN